MLGAIVGDILGSTYEWNNCKCYDTIRDNLTKNKSFLTDDTVLTLATADCILKKESHDKNNNENIKMDESPLLNKYNNFPDGMMSEENADIPSINSFQTPPRNTNIWKTDPYTQAYQKWGRIYSGAGYGESFRTWLHSTNPKPYNSWGNGSAMRCSPIGWVADDLDWAMNEAKESAKVTHNHEEGIKGAQAVAVAVYMARNGYTKDNIRSKIEGLFGYDLSRTVKSIRPNYSFRVSCQDSVPESIIAFLESNDFVDAVVLAISLGGDSDTIACITGSIAHAFYGSIPTWIINFSRMKLDQEQLYVLDKFCSKYVNICVDETINDKKQDDSQVENIVSAINIEDED